MTFIAIGKLPTDHRRRQGGAAFPSTPSEVTCTIGKVTGGWRMPKDGAEQGEPSKHGALDDTLEGDKPSPEPAIPNNEGPGLTGLMLSRVKERLRDLGTDRALVPQERDNLRAFYTHERNKLQLQLAVLGKTEKLVFCESALEEARKSLDFARSERGREDGGRTWQTHIAGSALDPGTKNPDERSSFPDHPKEDDVRNAEGQHSIAEAALSEARSELQTASAELARLWVADASWKDRGRESRSLQALSDCAPRPKGGAATPWRKPSRTSHFQIVSRRLGIRIENCAPCEFQRDVRGSEGPDRFARHASRRMGKKASPNPHF